MSTRKAAVKSESKQTVERTHFLQTGGRRGIQISDNQRLDRQY